MRFRGATSVVAVCPFCRSTLVREGVKLEDIGKQAELLEDHTPIRIGTQGFHRGEGFTVVGRIQFKYEAGIWNEWYVLMRGSKAAWLSDASREYSISYLIPPQQVPPFEQLKPSMQVVLTGDKWFAGGYSVTNLDEGEVVAGEGELPFTFTRGWKASAADLRGEGARFATIDYSEKVPHIYVGEKLPFDTFKFSSLRDPEQVGFTKGTARAFKCAGCGAPIERRLTTTEVVACDSCGTVTDVSGNAGALVQKNELNMKAFEPVIPLGAVGAYKGVRYEVVGFMRRGITIDGFLYEWSEWLVHNVEQGYGWLTEYNGHYNVVRSTAEIPKPAQANTRAAVRYLGRTFLHFQHAQAKVTYLAGEFYWRVKLGEENTADDYVDPPFIISSEGTGKEISWSIGEYVEPPDVFKAFNLKTKPPKPIGVAPNQPSPYKGQVKRYWLAFLAFVVVGLAAQFAFTVQDSASKSSVVFSTNPNEASRTVSPVFDIKGFGGAPLTVRTSSNASDWVDLSLQLTNADNGRAYELKRPLGFRNISGRVDGSAMDVAEVHNVPPGRYTLAVDARSPKGVTGTVDVYRSRVGWSNFFLLSGFLFLWPLIAAARAWSFESKRWSESDYAPAASSSDDDD